MKLRNVLMLAGPLALTASMAVTPAFAQQDDLALQTAANSACYLPPPPPVSQGNPVLIISYSSAGWTIQMEDRARNWHGERYSEDFAYGAEIWQAEYDLWQQYVAATHSHLQ